MLKLGQQVRIIQTSSGPMHGVRLYSTVRRARVVGGGRSIAFLKDMTSDAVFVLPARTGWTMRHGIAEYHV